MAKNSGYKGPTGFEDPVSPKKSGGEKSFVGDVGNLALTGANSFLLGAPSLYPPIGKFKRSLQQGRPKTTMAGNIAGLGGGLLLSGGVSLAGKGLQLAPGGLKVGQALIGKSAEMGKAISKIPGGAKYLQKGGDFVQSQLTKGVGKLIGTGSQALGTGGIRRSVGRGVGLVGNAASQGAAGVGALSATDQFGAKVGGYDDRSAGEIASQVGKDAGIGALFGGAVAGGIGTLGLGVKALGAGWRGIKRGAKDTINKEVLGSIADHKQNKLRLKSVKPMLKSGKFDEYITPEELDDLAISWTKSSETPKKFKNSEEFFDHFDVNNEAKEDLIVRYLKNKYPRAKNSDQLVQSVDTETQSVGKKMNDIVSELDLDYQVNSSVGGAAGRYNAEQYGFTLDDVVDDLSKAYGDGTQGAFKPILAGSKSERGRITEAAEVYFGAKKIPVKTPKNAEELQEIMNEVSNLEQQGYLVNKKTLDSIKKAENKILKKEVSIDEITYHPPEKQIDLFDFPKSSPSTQTKQTGSIEIIASKPQSAAKYKQFIKSVKDIEPIYESAGREASKKSEQLRNFVKMGDKSSNDKINSFYNKKGKSGVSDEYDKLIDEYSENARIYDLIGSKGKTTILSPFQYKSLAPQNVPTGGVSTGVLASGYIGKRSGFPGVSKIIQNSLAKDSTKKFGPKNSEFSKFLNKAVAGGTVSDRVSGFSYEKDNKKKKGYDGDTGGL